ncbi:MAG: ribosome biogenesis GTPase Der, partial [Heliobacteriaceae bacterium]|nr:ribosome biogenesis GTPase Der [Heliobacteriaceae bacterium]
LADIVRINPPAADRTRRLKIYYMTQVGVKPPTFILFVNKGELLHFSYKRYIENRLREAFGFEGSPLRLFIRERQSE